LNSFSTFSLRRQKIALPGAIFGLKIRKNVLAAALHQTPGWIFGRAGKAKGMKEGKGGIRGKRDRGKVRV